MNLAVIGCGNMATALIKGILKKNIFNYILVNDIDKDKMKLISNLDYKIKVTENYEKLISESDYLLIAVKPQNFEELFRNIKKYITDDKLIISIAAGKTINNITDYCGTKNKLKIIRVMPNTPALLSTGMSGIAFNENVTEQEKNNIIDIFNSVGKTLIVEEPMIDSITGVSGSGPAYVFYFIESFINAAVKQGFDKNQAELLVLQTVNGALKLVNETDDTPEILRKKVTSPGGTTEAALNYMMENKFNDIICDSVEQAKLKSLELSK